MEVNLYLIGTITAIITSIIIAWNNFFGLKDRFMNYLRRKLEIKTGEDNLKERYLENDRELYFKIKKYINDDQNMLELREYDFSGLFRDDFTKEMHHFVWECKKPDFEFHDTDIEKAKKNLEESVKLFLKPVGKYTFTYDDNPHFRCVPKDWRHRFPEKYSDVIKSIHEAADTATAAYDNFVRICKEKLAV